MRPISLGVMYKGHPVFCQYPYGLDHREGAADTPCGGLENSATSKSQGLHIQGLPVCYNLQNPHYGNFSKLSH